MERRKKIENHKKASLVLPTVVKSLDDITVEQQAVGALEHDEETQGMLLLLLMMKLK